MGKLSNLTSGKSIVPGEQIVKTMFVQAVDGNAAKLLEQVAKECIGSRIARFFPQEWEAWDGVRVKRGLVNFSDRKFPLMVKIGAQETADSDELMLRDVHGARCSMRPVNGKMVLEVGNCLTQERLESMATQMVGVWIVHGHHWRDRREKIYRQPWGDEKKGVSETLYFEIIDGALEMPRPTIGQLIERECRRGTHAGEWDKTRQSTIIAALVGMPMTLHEFKEKGGKDICSFKGLQIGANPGIWGVYCDWFESVRQSGELGMWQDLAKRCASPFTFHVHATRTIFPNARLDSDFLLEVVGRERLMAVLAIIATQQPERFYRVIDEHGVTHKQTLVGPDSLVYGKFGHFPRSELAMNAIQTFLDLQLVQANPDWHVPRKVRVVMDSHAYIIIEALARKKRVVHDLSGRWMHGYLTDGKDAKSHRARNERLFVLLRDIFGVSSMKFHIYPPVTWDTGLTSQYDENLKFYNSQELLAKEAR